MSRPLYDQDEHLRRLVNTIINHRAECYALLDAASSAQDAGDYVLANTKFGEFRALVDSTNISEEYQV